jgi:hypothetical protein
LATSAPGAANAGTRRRGAADPRDVPATVLWQRSDLEQMLVANPSALLRVAPEGCRRRAWPSPSASGLQGPHASRPRANCG